MEMSFVGCKHSTIAIQDVKLLDNHLVITGSVRKYFRECFYAGKHFETWKRDCVTTFNLNRVTVSSTALSINVFTFT